MFTKDFELSFDDFDTLRRLINQHSGIWLGESKLTFLKVRVGERMRALNIVLPREYYHFLKYDPLGHVELRELIDIVTVNQTWFFREVTPLYAWRDEVLPDFIKRGERVRLWSAGCSTGEEPYTLAMLLLDAYPVYNSSKFSVEATDISPRALEIAREGVYDPYSLRHTALSWKTRYFDTLKDGRFAVRQEAKRLVHFEHANLLDPDFVRRHSSVDFALCRNVIIYFDDHSRRIVFENLYRALKPGGFLALGHSEVMADVGLPFEITRVGKAILYRKKK